MSFPVWSHVLSRGVWFQGGGLLPGGGEWVFVRQENRRGGSKILRSGVPTMDGGGQ